MSEYVWNARIFYNRTVRFPLRCCRSTLTSESINDTFDGVQYIGTFLRLVCSERNVSTPSRRTLPTERNQTRSNCNNVIYGRHLRQIARGKGMTSMTCTRRSVIAGKYRALWLIVCFSIQEADGTFRATLGDAASISVKAKLIKKIDT